MNRFGGGTLSTPWCYTFETHFKKESLSMETSIPPVPASKTNIMSIISLLAGIIGFLATCLSVIPFVGVVFVIFSGLFGVIALVLGILGMNQVRKNAEKGKGMAIAGIVLGILILVGVCVYVVGVVIMGGSFLNGILSQGSGTFAP
jgi:hypothetical protein